MGDFPGVNRSEECDSLCVLSYPVFFSIYLSYRLLKLSYYVVSYSCFLRVNCVGLHNPAVCHIWHVIGIERGTRPVQGITECSRARLQPAGTA